MASRSVFRSPERTWHPRKSFRARNKKGDGGPSPSHNGAATVSGGLCLQPPIPLPSWPHSWPVTTDTKVRRLKAGLERRRGHRPARKSVWSRPMPTFFACIELGAALTHDHIAAARRPWPPNSFTPSILGLGRDRCAKNRQLSCVPLWVSFNQPWISQHLHLGEVLTVTALAVGVLPRRFFLKAMTLSPWPCSRISQLTEAPLTSGAPILGRRRQPAAPRRG